MLRFHKAGHGLGPIAPPTRPVRSSSPVCRSRARERGGVGLLYCECSRVPAMSGPCESPTANPPWPTAPRRQNRCACTGLSKSTLGSSREAPVRHCRSIRMCARRETPVFAHAAGGYARLGCKSCRTSAEHPLVATGAVAAARCRELTESGCADPAQKRCLQRIRTAGKVSSTRYPFMTRCCTRR